MTADKMGSEQGRDSARRRRIGRRMLAVGIVLVSIAMLPMLRTLLPVAVDRHVVDRGDVVVEVHGRGTVESERVAQVGFDLTGRLVAMMVDEGDRVTLGQELARLDAEQYEAQLRTAGSGVDAARASLHRMAAEERQARTAFDLAQREERRIEALVNSGVAPSQGLDLARDQRLLARDALDRVQAQISEASRSVEVARGSAEQSRVTTIRATLLAPFDGYVSRRFRDPGDTVAVGATVLRLVDTRDVEVQAWIDENALSRLSEGQSVRIHYPGLDRDFAGRLDLIGKEADRKTHELLVDIELIDRPDEYVIGQRAYVWIETDRVSDAVRIPTRFIRRDATGDAFCYVDRDGRIDQANLGLGRIGRDVVEVVSGLKPDDIVLTARTPGATLALGRRWEDSP